MKTKRGGHLPVGKVTLERALSKLGFASRTQARVLIESGEVKVAGRVVSDPRYLVRPETARIEVAGASVKKAAVVVLLLHKPRGLITTRSDEKGRKTVFSCLPDSYADKGHLHAVGRLDAATTGLLLLTNSTKISAWLTDPANEVPRIYLVTVRGEVSEETAETLRAGIVCEGELLKPARASLRKASRRESHLEIELQEGKNREIRRLMLAAGHEVTALKRIKFGLLELGTLATGAHRDVPMAEIRLAFPRMPV